MTFCVTLPWPPKELSPNARVHFHAKARVTKGYREAAYWLAIAAGLRAPDGKVTLRIDFYPPDRRRRDLDGMLSSIKSGLDGIADAMVINDHRFALLIDRADTVEGGKVVVQVQAS